MQMKPNTNKMTMTFSSQHLSQNESKQHQTNRVHSVNETMDLSATVTSYQVLPIDHLPRDVVADLRTDHAGETGAVQIYQGILYFARDAHLRHFAERHLVSENAHLIKIEAWLPQKDRSHLLPIWRLAGWLTGALPALVGPRAVYATIEAVETFVDHHYEQQVRRLAVQPELVLLRQTLQECQGDEVAHRNEAAAAKGTQPNGVLLRAWCWVVDKGSRGAVVVCRHI